jgi:hypothetical protein
MKKKPGGKAFNKAFDAVWDIGELGRQKKLRAQATITLKAIVEHGVMALEVLYDWGGDTTAALPAAIRALSDPDRIVRICAASVVSQHVE